LTQVALRGLFGRKLRTALTAIAIVLGVAMVSGTYVLTDTISNAFDAIFQESYRGTDAVVTARTAIPTGESQSMDVPSFPESVLAEVRGLPQVRDAIGGVAGEAQIIGKDGKVVVFGGAPNLGFSVDPSRPEFESLTLVDGAWPKANEVVIDEATADKEDFNVGDTIGIQGQGSVERLRLAGLVKFGAVSSIGGATLAGFDLSTAQQVFRKDGRLDQIRVAGKPGVPQAELIRELRQELPQTLQVRSGTEQADEDATGVNDFISFLQTFLLAFGGIALFVGSFVIANSLSITIAQRTREFATIRTLGGSRRQVLGSVIIESLVVGVLASVTGLFLGLGLAKGLSALFDAVGFTLPKTGLVFATRTIVVSLVVGIVITVLASLRPAIRATRVPPIAAVREGATLPESRFARFRTVGALALAAIGFAALLYGLFGGGLGTTAVLVWMGVGALLIFLGVALFSARIARPLSAAVSPIGKWVVVVLSALVWPLFTLPFWLLRLGAFGPAGVGRRLGALLLGTVLNPILAVLVLLMWLRSKVTRWRPEWPMERPGVMPDGTMSRVGTQNTQRNPQRTAATASALMIGIAIVTLVAVLASGITSTFTGAVNDLFTSDYAITAQNNFSPIPTSAAEAAAKTPGVEAIASVRAGDGRVYGDNAFVTAVDPDVGRVLTLEWKDGSQAVLGQLGRNGAFVDDGFADDHDLRVGSTVGVQVQSGQHLRLVVKGIFDPPAGGSPFGPVTMSSATFDRVYENPKNLYTFIEMRGGETAANTAALEKALAVFPNAKAQTREKFIDNQISGLNSVLNILYVLLALSVIVSLFGIVNTLVLTVFERTRELGMLRAIGMTRRQARRMIRHESVITALIGGVLGIILGVVLGAMLVARIDFIEFSLPTVQLIVFAVAAIVVGIVAAIFPARRAARLNVLEALQYE
jgi:putative ABC transport system permease protein